MATMMSDRIAPPRCSACGRFLGETYALTGVRGSGYGRSEYLKEVRGQCVQHGDIDAVPSEWNNWDMWHWTEIDPSTDPHARQE